ncbi:hypothetical protein [Amycolatopsis pigmentata]|uniref:Uncharacterized protein n=1 Tax=Amycolatopsis pigmentata TaxID=450801 RepID=A0ABW5G0E3_9PSEU
MPGERPHLLAASVPPERLVPALVRNMAHTAGGRVAYCVREPTGLAVVAAWPESVGTQRIPDDVVAREPVGGNGLVLLAAPRRWGAAEREALRETAGWLGVAARLGTARDDRDRARARVHALRAEVTTAREKLAQVRDIERRRLVRSITATTLRDLDGVRRRLRDAELARARDALDDLLESFRTVVRGVYPAMLPDRGPREALEELAATLPRPVRFRGDPGRSSWPAESGLYHAVAASLTLLAGTRDTVGKVPVVVDFGRDGATRVRVTAPAGRLSQVELRSALTHDAERLEALGGTMECVVRRGWAVVALRFADRPETAATPAWPLAH